MAGFLVDLIMLILFIKFELVLATSVASSHIETTLACDKLLLHLALEHTSPFPHFYLRRWPIFSCSRGLCR